MSASIRLHPEKGLNPHLAICPRCGKDNGEIVLLGAHCKEYICKDCGQTHIGRQDKCMNCGSFHSLRYAGEIGDHEKIPTNLCKECEEELDSFKKIVDDGGIYFRCIACHANGVIPKTHSVVALVREKLNLPTGPCGIEVEKKDCPVCRER